MKFTVDLWLDGYDDEEEMKKACIEFIRALIFLPAVFRLKFTIRPTLRYWLAPTAAQDGTGEAGASQ